MLKLVFISQAKYKCICICCNFVRISWSVLVSQTVLNHQKREPYHITMYVNVCTVNSKKKKKANVYLINFKKR